MDQIRAYYQLTKPGILRGNAIHILAGALLATRFEIDWSTLLAVLGGTSLIIASACVANNYMDRGIDAKMNRTKERPSVTGVVSLRSALVYASLLLVAGFAVLYVYTSLIVMLLGIVAYILYVFAYGYAKRHTIHSTLIGAIPGALPAMAGYVAIDGGLTVGAWLVFLLVFIWQMPHFYAISIFRKKEYQSAHIPVLGAIRPFKVVRRAIIVYILAYTVTVTALIHFDVTGPPASLLLLTGAAYWTIVFFTTSTKDEGKWARMIFGSSLLLTLGLLLAAILNVFVPPAL